MFFYDILDFIHFLPPGSKKQCKTYKRQEKAVETWKNFQVQSQNLLAYEYFQVTTLELVSFKKLESAQLNF